MFLGIFDLNKKDTEQQEDGTKIVFTYDRRNWPWQKKRVAIITRYNAEGQKHGKEETYEYYKDGSFSSTICPYEKNEKNGIEKEFNNKRKLIRETPWIWDGKIGVERTYYPDGRLKCEAGYSGTMISDRVRHYYPNGKIELEGEQKTNAYGEIVSIKCGDWRAYDEEGNLTSVTTYHDGNALLHKDYYHGGRALYQETIYHQDESMTERTYRTNGSIEKQETFDEHMNYKGLRILFDENKGIDDFEYYINDEVLSLETLSEITSIFGENSYFSPANMQKKSQELRNE